MSSHAWTHLSSLSSNQKRPKLSSVPEGFRIFLESKIKPVPSNDHIETDHVIRRALALWRLCWFDVPDGWEMLNERLSKTLGISWLEAFERRNNEEVRL